MLLDIGAKVEERLRSRIRIEQTRFTHISPAKNVHDLAISEGHFPPRLGDRLVPVVVLEARCIDAEIKRVATIRAVILRRRALASYRSMFVAHDRAKERVSSEQQCAADDGRARSPELPIVIQVRKVPRVVIPVDGYFSIEAPVAHHRPRQDERFREAWIGFHTDPGTHVRSSGGIGCMAQYSARRHVLPSEQPLRTAKNFDAADIESVQGGCCARAQIQAVHEDTDRRCIRWNCVVYGHAANREVVYALYRFR